MLENTVSRGKKQRIKSRIKFLKRNENRNAPEGKKSSIQGLATSIGVNSGPTKKQVITNDRVRPVVQKPKTESAKSKIDNLLKKRDQKQLRKEQERSKPKVVNEEDKKLMKQAKNKKRAKRRDEAKEEDDFDVLFKSHKKALLKKLAEKTEGADFEEVDISD